MKKILTSLGIMFVCTGSALALNVTVTSGDGVCPSNANLLTYDEAKADSANICNKLGTWYIARLAGGGSMDGPGYQCKIRTQDTRKLGNSLCKQQYSEAVTQGQSISSANMTNKQPWPPVDIYRPSGSQGANHQDLATFAWLNFVALSAPAGMRGNSNGSFADSGNSAGTTLVWETFQHRSELLPFNSSGTATAPQPWGATPKYQMKTTANPPQAFNVPFSDFNNLDEASQIGQNLIFFPKDPANPNPTQDWQILFEAKVNQSEYQFVYDNYQGALTNIKFAPFRFDPPISLPPGSLEVKVAWKPIDSIPTDQRYRYHTKTVIYYEGTDENPVAKTAEYALIGIHIIHKTPNYPTFVFATFQHVDNLVNQATGKGTGLYYVPAYDNIEYQLHKTTTIPATGQAVTNPTITLPNGTTFSTSNPQAAPNGTIVNLPKTASTIPGAKKVAVGGGKYVIVVPVTQPPTTNSAVANVNAQALAAMQQIPGFDKNFVWQYYKLKGVQGVPTGDETQPDYYLANDVIESSQPGVQLFRGGAPDVSPTLVNPRNMVNVMDPSQGNHYFSVGGCQGCHGVAQTQNGFDFNFLFFGTKGGGFNPDTTGLKDEEEMSAMDAKYRK